MTEKDKLINELRRENEELRKQLESMKWVPIKLRPMDSEERAYYEEQYGPLTEEEAMTFDCPMPEDGEEILISTKFGVTTDRCLEDYGLFLEDGDWDNVDAWMPMPERYKGANK